MKSLKLTTRESSATMASRAINYEIPFTTDTLTNTVKLVLSIPDANADSSYSLIHSFPSGIVGTTEKPEEFNLLELTLYPNPFSDKLMMTSNKSGIISIFYITGNKIDEFDIHDDKSISWKPSPHIVNGLNLINLISEKSSLTKKVLLVSGL